MKKKQRKNSLFRSLVLTSIFSASLVVSCSNSIDNSIVYNIEQSFFEQYSNDQIVDLLKFAKIYSLKKNNQNLNYLNAKVENNLISFKDLNKNYVASFNKKQDVAKQNINPNDIYIQYSQDEDKNNAFYLNTEFEKKYQTQTFVPDIQMSIFKILSNKQNFNQAIPNWIDINAIRSFAWVKNKEQVSYLEDLLTIHLKAFDIKSNDNREFHKAKFTNVKNTDFEVTFNVELLDKNEKQITNNKNETTFFINNFLNYAKATPLRLNIKNNDTEVLFNEYLNFPSLDFKTNPFLFIGYDNFVDGTFDLNKLYTAKSFASFLTRFPELVDLKVPYEKRLEDEKYELTNKIEYADFPSNTYSVLKLEVKVTKKNGNTEVYPWYSIDINRHYHLFKGYATSLLLNYRHNQLWSFINLRRLANPDFIVPEGIDPNTFYENSILNIVSFTFWKQRNNLAIWNNKEMIENEAFDTLLNSQRSLKYIENEISNIVLTFLIGNKKGDFLSGIKDIKLEYVNFKNPGSLEIKINFLDYNNNSLLSKLNQNKVISVNYFKGANIKNINKWVKANSNSSISLNNVPPLSNFKN